MNSLDGNLYQLFLSMPNEEFRAGFLERYPYDISPVPDDRPFFFRNSYWWHVFPGARIGGPFMEYTIIVLLGIVGAFVYLCIYLPLRFLSRRGKNAPGTRRYAYYFAGAGLGYFAVEIALLQKFGLFLGHPNYALSLVLAVFLMSTGIGSLLTEFIVSRFCGIRIVAIALVCLVILERILIFPFLADWVAWSFWAKAAVAAAMIFPIGLLLGCFLPCGLEQLKEIAPDFVPWAWGINGIFSVLAPILSVAFSMSWGINALLLSALPCYLMTGFALPARTDRA